MSQKTPTPVVWPQEFADFYAKQAATRITRAHMQWVVSHQRKRDGSGELRNKFYGHLREPLPTGTDTPEGHYHNDRQLDTLENRYRAQQGLHKRENS